MVRTYIQVDENNIALARVYVHGEVDAPVKVVSVSDPQEVELGSKYVNGSWVQTEQLVRSKRDSLLVDYVDLLAGNALRWAALTDQERTDWATYRQALLDVPAQVGFPASVTWPDKP